MGRIFREISSFYHGLRCLRGIEIASKTEDVSACCLLTGLYKRFAGFYFDDLADKVNLAKRIENADELDRMCGERNSNDNAQSILREEYSFWIGEYQNLCKRMIDKISILAPQVHSMFYELWMEVMQLPTSENERKLLSDASNDVFANATPLMENVWSECATDSLKRWFHL